jgi:hypothetical protein
LQACFDLFLLQGRRRRVARWGGPRPHVHCERPRPVLEAGQRSSKTPARGSSCLPAGRSCPERLWILLPASRRRVLLPASASAGSPASFPWLATRIPYGCMWRMQRGTPCPSLPSEHVSTFMSRPRCL